MGNTVASLEGCVNPTTCLNLSGTTSSTSTGDKTSPPLPKSLTHEEEVAAAKALIAALDANDATGGSVLAGGHVVDALLDGSSITAPPAVFSNENSTLALNPAQSPSATITAAIEGARAKPPTPGGHTADEISAALAALRKEHSVAMAAAEEKLQKTIELARRERISRDGHVLGGGSNDSGTDEDGGGDGSASSSSASAAIPPIPATSSGPRAIEIPATPQRLSRLGHLKQLSTPAPADGCLTPLPITPVSTTPSYATVLRNDAVAKRAALLSSELVEQRRAHETQMKAAEEAHLERTVDLLNAAKGAVQEYTAAVDEQQQQRDAAAAEEHLRLARKLAARQSDHDEAMEAAAHAHAEHTASLRDTVAVTSEEQSALRAETEALRDEKIALVERNLAELHSQRGEFERKLVAAASAHDELKARLVRETEGFVSEHAEAVAEQQRLRGEIATVGAAEVAAALAQQRGSHERDSVAAADRHAAHVERLEESSRNALTSHAAAIAAQQRLREELVERIAKLGREIDAQQASHDKVRDYYSPPPPPLCLDSSLTFHITFYLTGPSRCGGGALGAAAANAGRSACAGR